MSVDEVVHITDEHKLSRLLYPNPVCMLTTNPDDTNEHPNAMVLSWLSPANNKGLFIFSLNKRRHTVTRLAVGATFGLSVPTEAMAPSVLKIGSSSGHAQNNKLEKLDCEVCLSGWISTDRSKVVDEIVAASDYSNPFAALEESEEDSEEEEESKATKQNIVIPAGQAIAIADAVAHMVCSVVGMQQMEGDDDHWLMTAKITDAYVKSSYWNGKTFCAVDKSLPAFLTFLGSQTFGAVHYSSPEDKSDDKAAAAVQKKPEEASKAADADKAAKKKVDENAAKKKAADDKAAKAKVAAKKKADEQEVAAKKKAADDKTAAKKKAADDKKATKDKPNVSARGKRTAEAAPVEEEKAVTKKKKAADNKAAAAEEAPKRAARGKRTAEAAPAEEKAVTKKKPAAAAAKKSSAKGGDAKAEAAKMIDLKSIQKLTA